MDQDNDTDTQLEFCGAILFADICGSTPLFEDTGNWNALEIIGSSLDRHSAAVESAGGLVVRSKGDDLLCTFPDAEGALKAALHMLNAQAGATVEIRVGLHFGNYISARGDIFGDAVNVAARLMQLARPDEGIASGAFAGVLDSRLLGELEPFDQQRLKGKSDVTELYRVLPADDDATEMMSARTRLRQSNQAAPLELQLTVGAITRTLYEDDPPLKIGRADDADIQIANRRVSRAHATVALRDGRAILADRSTAGTWIAAGGNVLMVRRESMDLVGDGQIGLGAPPLEEPETTLRFALRRRSS